MNNPSFSSFALFGSMRSGSNLLEKFLNQYDDIFCHGELFNPVLIKKSKRGSYLGVTRKQRLENPALMLKVLHATTDGKLHGYRIFQTHNQWAIDNALSDPRCAKIVLTRDPIESFISLEIARKTDQWIISDSSHRKTTRIHFDLVAFSEYARERRAYYAKIKKALVLSGQPYIEIDYSMLGDLETINDLARFLGADERRTALSQPIKRQNPGAISDKILNYGEVFQALNLPETADTSSSNIGSKVAKPARQVGTDLSRVYFCADQALAFAPIPSVPEYGIRRWLQFHAELSPNNGFTTQRFADWQEKHPHPLVFSVVQHPLIRAYKTYMKKVFPTGPGAYKQIRHQLKNRLGLLLPPTDTLKEITPDHQRAALKGAGYGCDEHRIGFKQFLAFVAANLAGATDIRQDGKWQAQSEIFRRYRVLFPQMHVLHFETLRVDLEYLENRRGFIPCPDKTDTTENGFSFALSEIYDPEMESLAQAAYGQDYAEYGYGPATI